MGVAGSGLINLCQHIIREGSECVGPFLDDTETPCGLWEPKPGIAPQLAGGEVRMRELPRPQPRVEARGMVPSNGGTEP